MFVIKLKFYKQQQRLLFVNRMCLCGIDWSTSLESFGT